MVSGLVTSPCDQLRIFSGEASMMRMASKSVMGPESSNGFVRNTATLLGGPRRRRPRFFPGFFWGPSFPGSGVCRFQEEPEYCKLLALSWVPQVSILRPGIPRTLVRDCHFRRGRLAHNVRALDQLHVQAQRLQFANQHVERLRHARLDGRFALHDGLINFC